MLQISKSQSPKLKKKSIFFIFYLKIFKSPLKQRSEKNAATITES